MITDSNEILFIIYFFAALLILGIILCSPATKAVRMKILLKRLERALPQVQCAQCGYVGLERNMPEPWPQVRWDEINVPLEVLIL